MKITSDKIGHFKVGMLVALLTFILLQVNFGIGQYGILFAFLAGVLKELYDFLDNRQQIRMKRDPKHSVEFLDLWFTCLGGAIVIIFLSFFI